MQSTNINSFSEKNHCNLLQEKTLSANLAETATKPDTFRMEARQLPCAEMIRCQHRYFIDNASSE